MKPIRLFIGFFLAALAGYGAYYVGLDRAIVATIVISVLTGVWWVTEALPIPATSLVPIALLPLAGVITHKDAAASFGSHVVILLMASFMLSKALERSGVHERLALYMIGFTGTTGRRLHLLVDVLAT